MDESGSTSARYAGRHRVEDHRAPEVPGFDVVEPLGQGGSGSVWSATDAHGDMVAIKVVAAADAEAALVELAVLGRIEEPHLVRMREAVALAGGEVALVLDLLPGGSLGAAVRARGHLSPGETVTVLSPVASVLGRLHGMGVVHGDVAPGNVLLDLEGRPFLADLGVARIAGTVTGEVRGTDGFVAPEVLMGSAPTPAADVFAMGALAWFCLTGEAPEPAGIRRPLRERLPDLPEALADAIEGALRTRVDDRPDADALALAIFESAEPTPLELVRGGDDVSLLTRRIRAAARAAAGETPATAAGPSRRAALWRPTLRVPRARLSLAAGWVRPSLRWLGAVAAVLLTVVAVGAGSAAWSGAQERTGRTEASPASAGGPAVNAAETTTPSDIRLAPEAPRKDPVALVRALADARARAWSRGIAAGLVEVDAPRSPALARDTEVLAGVQRAGQRYVGLRFTVQEARVVGENKGVVTVRARIDTGEHIVRSAAGDQRRPAVAADPVLLDLVRTDSGWRVHDVRAVSS